MSYHWGAWRDTHVWWPHYYWRSDWHTWLEREKAPLQAQLEELSKENARLTLMVQDLTDEKSQLQRQLDKCTIELAATQAVSASLRPTPKPARAKGSVPGCPKDGEIDWTGVDGVLRYAEYGLDLRELRHLLETSDDREDDPEAKIVRQYYCDCCETPLNGFLQACEHMVGTSHAKKHKPTQHLRDLAENMMRAWIIIQTMRDLQLQ